VKNAKFWLNGKKLNLVYFMRFWKKLFKINRTLNRHRSIDRKY